MLAFFCQPQQLQDLVDIILIRPPSVQLDRHDDVFINIQHRHEIVVLKNKADVAPAKNRQRFVAHAPKLLSVDSDRARRRAVQPAQHIEQRRFAAA